MPISTIFNNVGHGKSKVAKHTLSAGGSHGRVDSAEQVAGVCPLGTFGVCRCIDGGSSAARGDEVKRRRWREDKQRLSDLQGQRTR